MLKRIDHTAVVKALTHGPKGEDKRQSCKKTPALRQIKDLKRFRAQTYERLLNFDIRPFVGFHKLQSVVADEQSRIALSQHIRDVWFSGPEVRMDVIELAKDDSRERDRRPRATVACHCLHFPQWNHADEYDTAYPVRCGNSWAGHNPAPFDALELNGRNQSYVDTAIS